MIAAKVEFGEFCFSEKNSSNLIYFEEIMF
jgi:hypothetical protein